ncbi:MAG TPA: hypothetical protein VGU20_32225 [Stellaceae bacterium]|nr:hypothetical protein [Stellaceae bacterium]
MTATNSTPNAELSARLRKAVHDHWSLFLVEGIILTVLGLAAIIVPPLGGLFVTVFLGWLFSSRESLGSLRLSERDRRLGLDGLCFQQSSP